MTLLKHNVLRIALTGFVCVLLTGCGSESSQPGGSNAGSSNPTGSQHQNTPPLDSANVANVAKVKVFADGTILLDDKPITIDELKTAFAELAEKKGVVWYYRENGTDEPPPQAMSVIEAVVEAKLPIKLSSMPDFSDSIGPTDP